MAAGREEIDKMSFFQRDFSLFNVPLDYGKQSWDGGRWCFMVSEEFKVLGEKKSDVGSRCIMGYL